MTSFRCDQCLFVYKAVPPFDHKVITKLTRKLATSMQQGFVGWRETVHLSVCLLLRVNNMSATPNRICLWSHPRTLSTAFEKCISFIDGAQIWHEPYVACYLNKLFTDPKTLEKFPNLLNFLQQFAKAKALLDEGGHIYQGGNLQPASHFRWVIFER